MYTFKESHLVTLRTAPAGRAQCTECEEMENLLTFYSVRAGGYGKMRVHEGAFCCLQCHDEHHGLRLRDRRTDGQRSP